MRMSYLAEVVVFFILLGITNGRVYYLDDYVDNQRYTDTLRPAFDNFEQSSRDLDLSFSAGDSVENVDIIRPRKKIYTVAVPEKPFVETNKQMTRPLTYKLAEIPERRNLLEDVVFVPDRRRKYMKLNDEDDKGEVIVDLRVIANHDSS